MWFHPCEGELLFARNDLDMPYLAWDGVLGANVITITLLMSGNGKRKYDQGRQGKESADSEDVHLSIPRT